MTSAGAQLIRLRLALELGLDPLPDLVGLRLWKVTWATIAEAAGISRQAAHERWSAKVMGILDRYGAGDIVDEPDH